MVSYIESFERSCSLIFAQSSTPPTPWGGGRTEVHPSAGRHTNRPSMIASSTIINTIAYSLNRPRRDISSSAIGTFPARRPARSKRASRERKNETSGALKRVQIITNTSRSSHLNYKERTRTRARQVKKERYLR